MIEPLPPAFIFIASAALLPLFKGKWRSALILLVPIVAFADLMALGKGVHWPVPFLVDGVVLARVDALSAIFGYIFLLISFITAIYSWHVEDGVQQSAGLLYAGSALGVVFAGDLFSLFIFWELLTVASIFLIWARRTEASQGAGFRYLLVHAAGGVVLLAGILIRYRHTGSIGFEHMALSDPGSMLIFLGFGINCAWPALHPWLTDAYPEATITGTVFLSAFTTKAAVYALARGFTGTPSLIWIGAIMTGFPIFYAVIENDLRRVLAYSLINQVGFMVCGIGIGTPLAVNGAVAHAFNDILFKGLLFMSMGAVMYRTGKINATDLGGLYRTMPWTCLCCIVGAASISAFPLFSGFVSKSMVMDAAGAGHMRVVWFILLFASAGVFHHAGIKIPFFAFFSHDSGLRPKEAPPHMLAAMGITAFLCIFIGSYPAPLYSLLPHQPVEYVPYTFPHVLAQTQILFFSALAFMLLLMSGIYPAELRAVNLDTDWIYRMGGRAFRYTMDVCFNGLNRFCDQVFARGLSARLGAFGRNAPARMVMLALALVPYLRNRIAKPKAVIEADIGSAIENGLVPVGVSAALSGLFVLLFYLLS